MTHYYEKNIVEIKCEYEKFLLNMLVPAIYDGFKSMYNNAKNHHDKLVGNAKAKNSLADLFKHCLKNIPTLNKNSIETETNRIKEQYKCSDWFDDLIKAVVKSFIVLLTFNASGKTCKLVMEKYHEKIDTCDFVHKCYIECGHFFYNHPNVFENPKAEEKTVVYENIRTCILNAIHRILPIRSILQEYLGNDYIVDSVVDDVHTSQMKERIKEFNQINSQNKELLTEVSQKQNIPQQNGGRDAVHSEHISEEKIEEKILSSDKIPVQMIDAKSINVPSAALHNEPHGVEILANYFEDQ